MAKKYFWEIPEDETDIETGTLTGKTITHNINYNNISIFL